MNFATCANTSTQNDEEINYTVFYAAAGIYVNAGWANFTNKIEILNGKTVYHVTGEGASNSKYDWIYRVRDKYESFIDTTSMQSLKFKRDAEDGKVKKKRRAKKNHKISFKMFLEGEVHSLYIRYLGKEEVKTKYAKFKAIKFRPLL